VELVMTSMSALAAGATSQMVHQASVQPTCHGCTRVHAPVGGSLWWVCWSSAPGLLLQLASTTGLVAPLQTNG
jgi:hypothetical protein